LLYDASQYNFGKIAICVVISQWVDGTGNKGKDKDGKALLASTSRKGMSLEGGIKAQSLTIKIQEALAV
jgi:hypothetical protein